MDNIKTEYFISIIMNAAIVATITNITVSLLKTQLKGKLNVPGGVIYIMSVILYIVYAPIFHIYFTYEMVDGATLVFTAWASILIGQNAYKVFEYYYGKQALKFLSMIGIEEESTDEEG